MISQPPSATSGPDPADIERVLGDLVAVEDWKGVVRLVERWTTEGRPSVIGLLAQARAFISLRLMDRAWVRLREATETEPENLEAQLLTAEMFIERGWPARAQRLLRQLREQRGDAVVPAVLIERAAEPPLQLPPDAARLEREGEPAELLALAERYLATGSIIRARSLLERLRREGESTPHIDALLWGILGDFSSSAASMTVLLEELRPDAGEWSAPERTESVELGSQGSGATDDPEESDSRSRRRGAFPTLFRREDGLTVGAPIEEDEVTASAVMASAEELLDPPPETGEADDPGSIFGDESADTQIMQVIASPSGPRLVSAMGPAAPVPSPESPMDLRALSERAGVGAADMGEDDSFLEEEDEDLVVMTRQEAPTDEPTEPEHRGPIEVIEKIPVPPAAPPPVIEPAEPAPLRSRWLRPLLVVATVALLIGGAGVMALQYLAIAAGDRIVDEVHDALADGDLRALQQLRDSLEQQVVARRIPLGVRAAELALVDAVLWHEFTGDTADRQKLEHALQIAEQRPAPAGEIALVHAIVAEDRGDLVGALGVLETPGVRSAEGRYLVARLLLEQGRAAEGLSKLGSVDVDAVRYQVLRVRLLHAAGQTDTALAAGRALLSQHARAPLVAVAASEQGWSSQDPSAHLDALDQVLQQRGSVLAPRLLGRLHAARAGVLARLGRAEDSDRAWRSAVQVDGTAAENLAAVTELDLVRGHVLDAAARGRRCLDLHPADARCLRTHIETLLELDRVSTARGLVSNFSGSTPLVLALDAMVAQAEARPSVAKQLSSQVLADGAGPETASGLAYTVLGSVLAQEGASEKAQRALERAARLLGASADPLDRRDAARAEASALAVKTGRVPRARLREIVEHGGSDPMVQVQLAEYYAARGRGAAAAQHLDRAVQVGPESALAHYERGRFYYDPDKNVSEGLDSWRRYLALSPEGTRADEVRGKPWPE